MVASNTSLYCRLWFFTGTGLGAEVLAEIETVTGTGTVIGTEVTEVSKVSEVVVGVEEVVAEVVSQGRPSVSHVGTSTS